MDVIFPHCAGLDVHKKTVMACRVTPDPTGQQADGLMELREFGTMTPDLLALSDWLAEAGITHVAMESTGEYWRPVYNLLEGNVTIFLVNAAHVKQVPGRKTDKADARWLAKLMRHGLLQASFIPPQGQRDLRDLTRDRTTWGQDRRRAVHRLPGVLERATITRAAVATAIRGLSGRAMVAALMPGRADPATRAAWAPGRMRPQLPLREQALTGLMRDHHRRLLPRQVAQSACLDEPSAGLRVESPRGLGALEADTPSPPDPARATGEVASAGGGEAPGPPLPFAQALAVLETMPGVDPRGAARWVAEGGPERRRCGPARRLSAWTGVAPGHDERAGKPRSGPPRRGHRTLRTGLTPIAQAVPRTKGAALCALSQRLAARRGKTRAIMAVAYALVVSAFHRLSRHEASREWGPNNSDERQRAHLMVVS